MSKEMHYGYLNLLGMKFSEVKSAVRGERSWECCASRRRFLCLLVCPVLSLVVTK